MPVGFNSPARNLFLLGSSGAQVVTNFFKTIDQSAGTDGVYLPDEIKYNFADQKYILAGSASDSNSKSFGWFEKRDYDGETEGSTADFENRIEATQAGVNTKLRALHLDSNDNLIVVGGVGDVPWIAKYSNSGVIDWQSTTNSANVEYTGVTSDSNGNYYACGLTPSSGDAQAFVEKFDANGNPGWGKSAFMLGRDVVLEKIAANDRGEVVAVGLLQDDEAYKGYVVKIDTNTGEVLWDRTLRSYEPNVSFGYTPVFCEDVFIDSKDQIYIVGRYFGISGSRGFIVKYTAEGNMIWQKETPVGENIEYYEVKSDGETEQTIVFGRYFDGATNDWGGILSKYSKDGTLVWRRTLFSSYNNSDTFGQAGGKGICLDADPSFYYLLYFDDAIDGLSGTPGAYTFGKVSSSGNGLGAFQYTEGTGETIYYEVLNVQDKIGRLSDGSVRNDTSDNLVYPFNANKILFDDLATQVSNKKRQMDSADSFEYSGSPAIRPADFQELNLLGDVYSGSGDWLDQSGKGNNGTVSGATHNAAGYWDLDGVDDKIVISRDDFTTSLNIGFSIETWFYLDDIPTLPTSRGYIWDQTPSANGVSFRVQNTDGRLTTFAYPSGGGSVILTATPAGEGSVSTLRWYHAVTVVDTNSVTLYVDGEYKGQATGTMSAVASSGNTDFFIGSNAEQDEFMNGKIGGFRVYQRALTAAQVFQNYNATKSKYINEAPDTAPKIGPGIVYDNNLLLNYDFGNRATYDRAENLHLYSEDLSAAGWTVETGGSVTANTHISPDGNQTADTLNGTANGSSAYRLVSLSNATTYTFSVFIKYLSGNENIRIEIGDAPFARSSTTFNTTTGVLVSDTGGTATVNDVVSYGNGWYRYSITRTTTSSGSGFIDINHVSATASSVAVWGFQVEHGSTAGRYIKTYGTAITAPTTVKNLSSSSFPGTLNLGAFINNNGHLDIDPDSNPGQELTFDYTWTSSFSIEMWIKTRETAQAIIATLKALGSGQQLSNDLGMTISRQGNLSNEMRFGFRGGSSFDPGFTFTNNQWEHYVITFNDVNFDAASSYTAYKNGSSGTITDSGGTVSSGQHSDNAFTGHDMEIGEFRIYDKVLTATEVSQNFNATRAKYGV